MMQNNIKWACLSCLCLVFFACQSKTRRKAHNIDHSINSHFERFDSDFYAFDTHDPQAGLDQLVLKYPEFTPLYFNKVVQFGNIQDSNLWMTIDLFFRDSNVINLYQKVEQKFNTTAHLEKDLTIGVRNVHAFFPELQVPKFYTHLSGFNQSLVVGSSFISVSLDDYMGTDFEYYEKAGIYKYQRQNMKEEKIVPDIITAWISTEFPQQDINASLIEDCIHRGKILYATASCLPYISDSLLIGYNTYQYEWASLNEGKIWHQFVGSEDIFRKDFITKNQYLNDGPFTKPISQNSPPRLGVYIGWKIIQSYMENHKDITLQQLMEETNYQAILDHSNYLPKIKTQ